MITLYFAVNTCPCIGIVLLNYAGEIPQKPFLTYKISINSSDRSVTSRVDHAALGDAYPALG